jgi:hypothetical protein
MLLMLAPAGGIANSAAPTSANNTEVIGLPAPSATSARCLIARYSDAIFFGIHNTTSVSVTSGFLAGRIGAPVQNQDVAAGLDGLGILANLPNDASNTTENIWYSTSAILSGRKSRLKISALKYAIGVGAIIMVPTQSAIERRFSPVILTGNPNGVGEATTSSPILCLSKYTAFAAGIGDLIPCFSMNISAGTNQAWMAINNSQAGTRHRILWNKTVDPNP